MNMCSSASALWHVRSLLVVCLLSLTCGDATATSVQYLYGTYTSSCSQICNAAGLFCADSMIESMNCAAVAKSHCRSSSLSSNPNVGCTVSGCYVNCQKSFYYSKSSSFSSCNTAGTCLTTSSNLYKHCPCYEQASTELEGWAKIGLYLAGAIVLICVVFLVRLGMQQMSGRSNDHEALHDDSGSDYDIEVGERKGFFSAFSGMFGKSDSEASQPAKKKKKNKKVRYKTKLPLDQDMDETRDMTIK